MKQKKRCEDCSRVIFWAKLHQSQFDKRLLCGHCFSKENKERNYPQENKKMLIIRETKRD